MSLLNPRTLGAALAAALVAVPLAACTPGRDSEVLHVWMYQDDSDAVQQAAVDRFNATSDVQIELNRVPGDNYLDALRAAMGSPNAPDVFFNWGGDTISDYVANGDLLDLGPVFEEDPAFQEQFIPAILDAGQINGAYYGVPLRGMQPVILFYNENVFEEAGAEPPQTWEDVLDLVDVFIEEDTIPFALAGATPWTEQMWLQYLVDRIGGPEVFNRIQDGDFSAWTDPAVLEAAQTVADLVERGAFGETYGSVSYTEGGASTLFAQGEAAMHLMGSWEYANHLANAPGFAEDGLGWTVFPPMPGGAGDPDNVVGNPTNYWSINAHTDHLDAAVEFVKLASAEEEYVTDLIENGEVPALNGIEEDLEQGPHADFARYPYDMVLQAPHFQLSWDLAVPPDVAPRMVDAIEELFNGQISPEEFTDRLSDL